MKITAVIVAGGKGTRMGADKNKVFLKILGREVLYYTISAFEKNDKIDDIIVVTGKNDIEECQILVDKYGIKKVSYITEGGATRQESVMNGLKKANIAVNRKMLSEIAIADPAGFSALVEKAKAAL